MIKSYRDLIVWQKSMSLAEEIYRIARKLPKEEMYSLSSQIRRCAISLPSNIAEGRSRGTRKDFRHFITTAYGSGAELEAQLELITRIFPELKDECRVVAEHLGEIMRMLQVLIERLGQKPITHNL